VKRSASLPTSLSLADAPELHQFRIYGSHNGLILDQDQETLIKLGGARFKSYAEKFIPPVIMARQYLGNLATNLRTFSGEGFHMKAGMKYLIESFYRSIVEGTPVPIPYREIVLTARIMDAIWGQLDAKASRSLDAVTQNPYIADCLKAPHDVVLPVIGRLLFCPLLTQE